MFENDESFRKKNSLWRSLFMGPLGVILSVIMSLRRNWDMIVSRFTAGGLLGGITAIGKVLLDAILQPVQQIVALIGKVTGADWAMDAAASIESFRKDLGVNVEPAINPRQTQQEATNSTIENIQRQQVGINIKNESRNPVEATRSGGDFVPVKLSSTWGGM